MKRRRSRLVATVVVPLVMAILMIANSSSAQLQEGTGKAKQRATGLVVNWPD